MDQTLVTQALDSLGYGAYVPAVLSVVGAFSAVAAVYPANWKGAATIHKLALLVGNAKPAVPAVSVATVVTPAVLDVK